MSKLTLKSLWPTIKEQVQSNELPHQEQDTPETKTKKLFVLVGPPSVGKSTWIQSTFAGTNPYVINRDDIVESVAVSYGWSYDDMFVGPPPDAQIGSVDQNYGVVVKSPGWMTWQPTSFSKVLEANNKVEAAFSQRVAGAAGQDNVVVDMTNMNTGARKKALSMIEGAKDEYEKIAVVFEFEGVEDLVQKVALKRAEAAKRMGKSKTVPPAAIARMFSAFQRPTAGEGFDRIMSIDNRELLKKLVSEETKTEPAQPQVQQEAVSRWQVLAGIVERPSTKLIKEQTMPTVNLNGTGVQALVDQAINASQALHGAIEALHEAAPNGRDYQLNPGSFENARKEFEERLNKLREVKSFYDNLVEYIVDYQDREEERRRGR